MISYFNTKIKIPNAKPTKNVGIELVFNNLGKEKVKAIVNQIRSETDIEKRKKLKETLPYFTPHATFTKRANKNLLELSGFLMLDWDKKDNPNESLEDLKEKILENPFVFGLFESPSGGLKIFIKTNIKEYENEIKTEMLKNGKDVLFYPEFYKAFHYYFEKEFETNFDIAQGKLSQPCFLSYDPNYYISDNYEVFDLNIAIKVYKDFLAFENNKKQIENKKIYQKNKVNTGIQNSKEEDYIANLAITVYQNCIKDIEQSTKGNLHDSRIKAAYLAGGYVSGGILSESTILPALISAARNKSSTPDKAEKEVIKSFENGKKRPITKADKLEEKKEWIEKNVSKLKETPKQNPFSIDDFAYKKILKYSRQKNNSGTYFETADYKFLSEEYKIPYEKVKNIVENFFEKNKETFDIDNKPKIEKVKLFLKKNYNIRYNIIKDRPEHELTEVINKYSIINNSYEKVSIETKKWIEFDLDTAYVKLQENYIKYSQSDLRSLIRSDFFPKVNHFEDFFLNLKPYDSENEIDYLKEFCSNFTLTKEYKAKTKNEIILAKEMKNFFTEMLKKHLIRAINTALTNEENRYCFTFAGENEFIGKSKAIRHLNIFGSEYHTEKKLTKVDDKDLMIATSLNFFFNFDEVDGIPEKLLSSLKAFISQESVNERGAYLANAKIYPRRCSFFATTNKLDFLLEGENTRWLVFDIESIDWQNYKKISVKDIWRQLFYLYVTNYNFQLTDEEKEIQKKQNESYKEINSEQDLIEKYINRTGTDLKYRSVTEIMIYLNGITGGAIRLSGQKIGIALKKLGFAKSEIKRSTYLVSYNLNTSASEQQTILDNDNYVNNKHEELTPPEKNIETILNITNEAPF